VCPIEKLETIVKIHIPKLAPDLSEYRDAIQDIVIVGNQIKNLMNIDPLIEEGDDNYNYAIEELANIRERCKRFEEEHKKLHLRLEKLASRF
jgi:DNA repair exonuclease SbcCD ATPase subunit